MSTIYAFSPCKSTLACAQAIAQGIDEEISVVNVTLPRPKTSGEPQGINIVAVPVFKGHVPPVAFEHLDKALPQEGKAIGVVVYGNRAYDNAANELYDYLTNKGLDVVGLAAAVAEHTMYPDVAKGRPDAQDTEKLKALGAQLSGATQPIDASSLPELLDLQPYSDNPSPVTSDDCVRCGLCERNCPTQVIVIEEKSVSPETCLACNSCIYVCPQQARSLPQPVESFIKEILAPCLGVRKEPEIIA